MDMKISSYNTQYRLIRNELSTLVTQVRQFWKGHRNSVWLLITAGPKKIVPHTRAYVTYSLRTACGFFSVQQNSICKRVVRQGQRFIDLISEKYFFVTLTYENNLSSRIIAVSRSLPKNETFPDFSKKESSKKNTEVKKGTLSSTNIPK